MPRDGVDKLLPTDAIEARGGRGRGGCSEMEPLITAALEDDGIVEIMLNPDGALWVKRRGADRIPAGEKLPTVNAERVIRLVASHVGQECEAGRPIVSVRLPETGEHFEGILPPLTLRPVFAIRKPVAAPYALDDYVRAGIMSGEQADVLRHAIASYANILIVGDVSTGKTTLANALLEEIAHTRDRVAVIEEIGELRYASHDFISLRLGEGAVSLAGLVRASRRLRPDRIVVGEIRGREAVEILEAWRTDHPGGITTLRAGSAADGLRRLERLVGGEVVEAPRSLIADAIDVVVFIAGRPAKRRVEIVAGLAEVNEGGYRLEVLEAPDCLPGVEKSGRTGLAGVRERLQ